MSAGTDGPAHSGTTPPCATDTHTGDTGHQGRMGLVAEYEITCEHLPLVGVAADVPTATLEVEIQSNHGDRPPFLVHATGESETAVERAFESAAFVAEYTLVGRAGETRRHSSWPRARGLPISTTACTRFATLCPTPDSSRSRASATVDRPRHRPAWPTRCGRSWRRPLSGSRRRRLRTRADSGRSRRRVPSGRPRARRRGGPLAIGGPRRRRGRPRRRCRSPPPER